uniref:Putative secreted protein n=1 Tax=Anopheles darlingi TaxID=43151 RepID=A0A2M4DPK1_ANODA
MPMQLPITVPLLKLAPGVGWLEIWVKFVQSIPRVCGGRSLRRNPESCFVVGFPRNGPWLALLILSCTV